MCSYHRGSEGSFSPKLALSLFKEIKFHSSSVDIPQEVKSSSEWYNNDIPHTSHNGGVRCTLGGIL
jgi:hypothetical protein